MAGFNDQVNDHRGMWLIWIKDPVYRRKAWSLLEAACEKRILNIWKKDITEHQQAIGCVTEDDRDVMDIGGKGEMIRDVLGDLAPLANMYYKSKEAILKGLSSHKNDWYICHYRLRKPDGHFQERDPSCTSNWVDVIFHV